jgi:hypothetical protein
MMERSSKLMTRLAQCGSIGVDLAFALGASVALAQQTST